MNEDIAKFFSRFVVYLTANQTLPGYCENKPFLLSGFLFSVQGYWFFMSAAHCFEKVQTALDLGSVFSQWAIVDHLGAEAKFNTTVPFDYQPEGVRLFCDEDTGDDYGIMAIRPLVGQQIMRNRVQPVDERMWKQDIPNEFDAYWMLGVPAESVVPGPDGGFGLTNHFIKVEPEDDPPVNLIKPGPRFYARIVDAAEAPESIEGMSGGPVFGIKRMADGSARAWVIAVQSEWCPKRRVIAACLLYPFAEWLSEEVKAWDQEAEGSEDR